MFSSTGSWSRYPLVASLLLACAGAGCTLQSNEEASPVQVVVAEKPLATRFATAPSAAERSRAELAATAVARDGKVPEDLRGRANARVLLIMAALDAEPKVTIAALRALRDAYGPRALPHKAQVDADFVAVVSDRLQSGEPAIRGAALQAARAALPSATVNQVLLQRVLEVGAADATASARFAMLEALGSAHHKLFAPAVLEVVLAATRDPEPRVAAAALGALEAAAPGVEWTDERVSSLVGLIGSHADPAVRGQALGLLRRIDDPARGVSAAVLRALADPHPFVRAEAAKTAGALKLESAIPLLARLLEDRAGTRYAIEGFATLDGSPGRLVFGRGSGVQVRSFALEALAELSSGAIVLESGKRADRPEFDRDVVVAKNWALRAQARVR